LPKFSEVPHFILFSQSRQPQVKESSSSSHRRGHFPHWLFPHDHQPKHSRSPPPSTTPPPPPPRNTALRCKPLTRSVEVQTEPPVPQSCCCTNTDFNPLLYESKNVTSCWCTASQGQPIMLHHYHMHHYYHCEEQQPQQQQHSAIGSTSNSVPGEPQGTGFRTSSPLIKLSATWPPNIAITGAEEAETTTIMTTTATETQSPQQEDCCELSPSTEEAPCPPTHVSSALRTVESPQEQVITPKDDPQEDQRGVFLQNIAQLKRTGWYWGPLTIEEAELLLQDRPNGSFLVRDSGHELYILSLSFRAEDRTYHTRIEHTGGKFGFAIQGGADTTSSSIAQFINHVIAESERGKSRFFLRQSVLTMSPTADQNGGERVTNHLEGESHYVEARLLYPVSRFLVVHSLAHLCRFEILLKVRKDHIDHLPLPDPLKKYLHERQYYTEFVQAYLESIRGGEGTEQVSSKGVTSLDS
uniref:Suppressor of cytokine signaling 7 n=1 Tax=Rodentolepis nana TaxID=102285 RepID=A0A0R3TMI6_RODNA